jgi:hypothetical protein
LNKHGKIEKSTIPVGLKVTRCHIVGLPAPPYSPRGCLGHKTQQPAEPAHESWRPGHASARREHRAARERARSAAGVVRLPAASRATGRRARLRQPSQQRRGLARQVGESISSPKRPVTGEGRQKGSAAAFSGELGATPDGGVLQRDVNNEGAQVQLNPKNERQGGAWRLLSPVKRSQRQKRSKHRRGRGLPESKTCTNCNRGVKGCRCSTKTSNGAVHRKAHRRGVTAAETARKPSSEAAPRGRDLHKRN